MLLGRMGGCQTVLLCSAQVGKGVKGYGIVIKQVIQFMFALLVGGMADTQRHSLS